MALTKDEIVLLRQLICSGFFNGEQRVRENIVKLPLTPQVLEAIASKSEEELRDLFALHKAQRRVEANNKKSLLEAELEQVKTQLEETKEG